jgi:hypothetical protein
MKKAVLILFLLAVAVTGVLAQSNTAVADLRKELYAYIDAIPVQSLSALKPILAILAEPVSDKSELNEILDAIPPRNIEAVKALLLALSDPSYNIATVTSQLQAKPTEAAIPAAVTTGTPAKTNEPVKTGKFSVGGGAFFDWSLKSGVEIADNKILYNLMSIGGYGFLDTKFFELSIGPSFGMGTSSKLGIKAKINLLQLDINFLGKFPIDLPGDKFCIFPMLGIS